MSCLLVKLCGIPDGPRPWLKISLSLSLSFSLFPCDDDRVSGVGFRGLGFRVQGLRFGAPPSLGIVKAINPKPEASYENQGALSRPPKQQQSLL